MSKVIARSASVLQAADRIEMEINRTIERSESLEAAAWLEETFHEAYTRALDFSESFRNGRLDSDYLRYAVWQVRGKVKNFTQYAGTPRDVCVRHLIDEFDWWDEHDALCHRPISININGRMTEVEVDCNFDRWPGGGTAARWPNPLPDDELPPINLSGESNGL